MPRVIHFEIPADHPERAVKFEQSGGKTVAGKMAIPGVGYLAYCQDHPEGNTFGIMQADAAAQ